MRKYFTHLKIFLIISTLIGFAGCLSDEESPVFNISLADNAMLLGYLEEQGDYINSPNMPSIVNVDEVFNNINDYLIVDTRTSLEYTNGRIPGAINIQNDSLVEYLNSIDINQYPKVVLVSSDGQASSYYTSLLRLYGISNTYSLLFGMAQWNQAFSDIWLQNLGDNPVTKKFDYEIFINDSLSNLPDINFPQADKDFRTKVKDRIAGILKTGFLDNECFVTLDPEGSLTFNGEDASDFYIACFGIFPFYKQNQFDEFAKGHFPNSVSFVPYVDLKSTGNLQLLPNNKKIVVYSYSGQMSAFVVAYLRVLGYDAKSLLYGGNKLFYSFMFDKIQAYTPFVFLYSDIRNYSYITGAAPK